MRNLSTACAEPNDAERGIPMMFRYVAFLVAKYPDLFALGRHLVRVGRWEVGARPDVAR